LPLLLNFQFVDVVWQAILLLKQCCRHCHHPHRPRQSFLPASALWSYYC
jgi:hypothetical protein